MKKFCMVVALLVAACGALPTMAATRQGLIHTTFSAPQVLRIMQAQGYTVRIDRDGDIEWTMKAGSSTYKGYITFYKDNRSIQFFIGFRAPDVTLQKHNQFNKDYRFGRSLMPRPGSARLEADLDFDGGISEERLVDFFRTCQSLFQTWYEKVL